MLRPTRYVLIAHDQGCRDDLDQVASDNLDIRDALERAEDGNQLIAAETRRHVRAAQAMPEPLADLPEHQVASLVSERVVDPRKPCI